MNSKNIQFILTDIEGTTTSVSFVYDILFPYFRNNISKLKDLHNNQEVHEAFEQVIELTKDLENLQLIDTKDIIGKLLQWSLEDKKITPLKTLQGILWQEGYKSKEIKGHVYPDVKSNLIEWKKRGINLGVFSSGSVTAQKLIFGYSEQGDLTPYFSYYFGFFDCGFLYYFVSGSKSRNKQTRYPDSDQRTEIKRGLDTTY